VLAALAGLLVAAIWAAVAPADQCSQRRGRGCAVSAVGVREHEFRISLSRLTVAPGRVIVELDNEGQDGHDLRLAPLGSQQPTLSFDELRPGWRATKVVTLRRGTYRLWCSLPGHDAAGMHALLRVR
jgi:plastocyanin